MNLSQKLNSIISFDTEQNVLVINGESYKKKDVTVFLKGTQYDPISIGGYIPKIKITDHLTDQGGAKQILSTQDYRDLIVLLIDLQQYVLSPTKDNKIKELVAKLQEEIGETKKPDWY